MKLEDLRSIYKQWQTHSAANLAKQFEALEHLDSTLALLRVSKDTFPKLLDIAEAAQLAATNIDMALGILPSGEDGGAEAEWKTPLLVSLKRLDIALGTLEAPMGEESTK